MNADNAGGYLEKERHIAVIRYDEVIDQNALENRHDDVGGIQRKCAEQRNKKARAIRLQPLDELCENAGFGFAEHTSACTV